MAEEIIQRMGFETGNTIPNIEAVKTALSGLNMSLGLSASALQSFNQAASSASVLANLTRQLQTLQTTMHGTNAATRSASGGVSGFVSQIGKIIAFRSVIASLNDVNQAIHEGVDSAAKFSMSLGQTAAIMDSTSLSIGGIREKLVSMSSEFAKPLDDVASGYYQTMQNQLGTAAQSMEVFGAAANLAAANNVPLVDTINLLSSGLKGWNLDVSEAGRLSGMFFEAIKVGRMDASDLADVLGRVGPTAAAMGISIEEAMSAVAVMTQQGTKAGTAITQLNALMMSLLKPTDTLKAAMKDIWGVDNAEQALTKFGGFIGVLQAMEQITSGNSDEMVKLTANVRAIRTEMGLAGENADVYVNTLKLLKDATSDTARVAAESILKTPGGEYKKAVNDVALAWSEAGDSMLGVATIWNKLKASLINWAQNPIVQSLLLTAALAGVAVGLTTLVGAYAALGAAAAVAAPKVAAFMLALGGPIAWIIAGSIAVGAAIGALFSQLSNKSSAAMAKMEADTKKAYEAITQNVQAQVNLQMDGLKKVNDEQARLAMEAASRHKIVTDKEYNQIKANQALIVSSTKQYFDGILEKHTAYINKLVEAESAANQKIRDLKSTVGDKQAIVADKTANQRIQMFDKEQQAQQALLQGDKLRNQALSVRPKTEEEVKQMEKLLARSQQFYDSAEQVAAEENVARIAREKSLQIDKDRVSVAEQQVKLTEQESKGLPDRIATARKDFDDLNKGIKEVEASLVKLFGGTIQGKQFPGAKTSKEFNDSFNELIEKFSTLSDKIKIKPFAVEDILDLSKVQNKLQSHFNEMPAMLIKVALDSADIGKQLLDLKQKQTISLQNEMTRTGLLDPGVAGIRQVENLKKAGEEAIKELGVVRASVEAELSKVFQSLQVPTSGKTFEQQMQEIENSIPAAATSINELKTAVDNMFNTANTGDRGKFSKALVAYIDSLEKFKATIKKDPYYDSGVNPFEFDLKQAMSELDQYKQTFKEVLASMTAADPNALQDTINNISSQLNSISGGDALAERMASIPLEINNATSALPNLGSAIGGVVVYANNLANAFSAVNAQINAAIMSARSLAAQTPGVATQALGGVIHRAIGGPAPRWTDTQMAMLTPGEIVMNTTASRKFAPQLNAMNLGSTPIFRERGGAVTNVGDINVTVNGGDSSSQTIQSIANGLRRGIKRGTIRLT